MLWRASYHCFCFGLRMHCTRAFFCIHCTLAVASNGAALYPHSYNRRKKVQQTGMMKFDACKRRLQHLASEQLCANSFSQNHQTRSRNDIFHLFLLLCSIVVQESVEKFNAAQRFASGAKMVRLDRISKRSGSCPIAGILQIIPNDEVPPLQSQ